MGILKDVVMPLVLQNTKHSDTISEIQLKGDTEVKTTHEKTPDVIKAGVATGVASGVAKGASQSLFRKSNKSDGNRNNKSGGSKTSLNNTIVLDTKKQDVWAGVKPSTKEAFSNGLLMNLTYPKNWDSMSYEDRVAWLDASAARVTSGGAQLLKVITTSPLAIGTQPTMLTTL